MSRHDAEDPDASLRLYYDTVGPFYDSAGARAQLENASAEQLTRMRARAQILAVRTGGGTWLYPGWQFTGHGEVHAVLQPVLAALSELDGWLAGIWLSNPHVDLDGLTPRQALAAGFDSSVVAMLASHDATTLLA